MTAVTAEVAEHFTLGDGDEFELNLSGAKIPGASLPNMMLNYANFSGCDLTGADFSGANLVNADFNEACLMDVNFQDADLSNANFTNAILSYSDFRGANLVGAKLYTSDLQKTRFEGVNLSQSEGLAPLNIVKSIVNDGTILPTALKDDLLRIRTEHPDLWVEHKFDDFVIGKPTNTDDF